MTDRHVPPPYSRLDIELLEAGYPIRSSTPDGRRHARRRRAGRDAHRPRWRRTTNRRVEG